MARDFKIEAFHVTSSGGKHTNQEQPSAVLIF